MNSNVELIPAIKAAFHDEYVEKAGKVKKLASFVQKNKRLIGIPLYAVGLFGGPIIFMLGLVLHAPIAGTLLACSIFASGGYGLGFTYQTSRQILQQYANKMMDEDLAKGPDSVLAKRYKDEILPKQTAENQKNGEAAVTTAIAELDCVKAVFNSSSTKLKWLGEEVEKFLTPKPDSNKPSA